jgi:O-antigen/teichoic acid export membrane protein
MTTTPHDPEEFDHDLPPIDTIPAVERSWVKRGRKAAHLITKFIFGQGAAQSASLLANFFLVHTLSVEAYAQFGLATGFQTVFSVLMDMGFASTIVPMVGENREDATLVGRYVRSASHLRTRLFWFLAPVASVAFLAIMHRHHWSLRVQALLLASVLLSLYSSGKVSYFSAPLFIFGRLKEYYLPQVFNGIGRLLGYILLFFTNGLNAWTAAGLSAINITLNGSLIHKASKKYFEWPQHDDPVTDRELLQYILPASPAIIFSAFQSQISLFLISIFGGTSYIAEVAALSRIGQLFTLALTFYAIVIEPHVARMSRDKLRRTFLEFIFLATAICTPVVLIAFFFPKPFLLILGAKYRDLGSVMGVYVLSCCLNVVSSLMWVMNRARKWVFWSGSILEVALLVGVQITYLITVGVKDTQEAVFFNLASSFCYLIAHGYSTIYGFIKGPRPTV